MISFRRPTVLPVHPAEWKRPAGNTDFRVTQTFDAVDYYHQDGRRHNAVDLGNFTCGPAVVAMAPGIVRLVKDNATALGARTDALGAVIDHGEGITTEYWHLNAWTVAQGARVTAGQQIGIVGRTGLGDVCHLHIEAKRNGVRFDPEPLIFGGSIGEEDDMPLPVGMTALVQGVIGGGNNIRKAPSLTAPNYTLSATDTFTVLGFTKGGKWTIGAVSGDEWAIVARNEVGYVARPLVTNLTLTAAGKALAPAGGISSESYEALRRLSAGFLDQISDSAGTAADKIRSARP